MAATPFQTVAGHQELLGPDVTISHLLLKNHVADLIGRSADALVTESAVAQLDILLEWQPDHRAGRALRARAGASRYPDKRSCQACGPVDSRVVVLQGRRGDGRARRAPQLRTVADT
jgi:hypothetical protein